THDEKEKEMSTTPVPKKVHRRYGLIFGLIMYIFIISDLYIRVTPFLIIILLYPKWSLVVFLTLAVLLSVIELVMLRFVMLKATVVHKWKEALRYFSIGIISGSYYLLCCIGLKWLPQNVNFRTGFAIEHNTRMFIAIIMTAITVYLQSYDTGWTFAQTTALIFFMLVVNFVAFVIMLYRLK
ncbi:hypothetical protein RFI_01074, partial [Reticulomyxa filosa]